MTSSALQQARLTARRHAERITHERLAAHGILMRNRPGRRFRLHLWLPASLLWIAFPLVILLSPLAMLWRGSPTRLMAAVAALIAGLPGAKIEAETPDADIHIRLF